MKNIGLDIFLNAEAVSAKPSKKAAKKKTEVSIEGLELVAALDAAEKTIKSLKESAREQVDARVRNYFVDMASKAGKRPDNFRGVEGKASASCELRKRSTRSPLSDVEIGILEANEIPYEEVGDVTETFIINPEYLGRSDLMTKVSKALAKADLPADFIQKQVANKTKVVTDDSLSAVFSKTSDNLTELLKIVTTIALKPQTGVELSETFEMIAALVYTDKETGSEDQTIQQGEQNEMERCGV